MELELELIPTKILELELESNPKPVTGIGIGINSIFFGMSKGLHVCRYSVIIILTIFLLKCDCAV